DRHARDSRGPRPDQQLHQHPGGGYRGARGRPDEPGLAGTGQPVTSILAQLSVRRGRAAIEFYKTAFGAVEDYRVGGTDENEAVVAQLSVGDATFWVADESPPHQNFSPESLGGSTTRMLLIADDP